MAHAQPHGGSYNPSVYSEGSIIPTKTAHGGSYYPSIANENGLNRPSREQPSNANTPLRVAGPPPLAKETAHWVPQPPSQQVSTSEAFSQQTLLEEHRQEHTWRAKKPLTLVSIRAASITSKSKVIRASNPLVHSEIDFLQGFATDKSRSEKEFPVVLKGDLNIFNSRSRWRGKNPYFFQNPGYVYDDAETIHRHRDFAGRETHKVRSDRYLHHNDGYLRNLYVATTDDIYDKPGSSTWRRTFIKQVAPWRVRLATWVVDYSYDPESWKDWWIGVLRALPATVAIGLVIWEISPPIQRRNGAYAPILYNYYGDAKIWSNSLENGHRSALSMPNNQVYRILKPRHLCFLREARNPDARGVDVRLVADWEDEYGEDCLPEYMFVAYSTEQFNHASEKDLGALHNIAEIACRQAKIPAYWVACSCMWEPAEIESDVFRISDVLRGASKMIIALGPGRVTALSGESSTGVLLREWGNGMWTFPEILLSPGQRIKVYTRGTNLSSPVIMHKNQFAYKVWSRTDAEISRHLVDHSLGNIDLSRIELSVIGLKCLFRRKTTEYLPGDQAYALMGLLRQRPQIDQTDSAFQAFARLSLANDSDKLLERYICTLPLSLDQPWHNMDDAYQSSLWDISPYCQVAGIAGNDTVIIDGAWGMSIRWKSFYPVYWSSGPSWKRWFAVRLLEWNGLILTLAFVVLGTGSATRSTFAILLGFFILLLFLYCLLKMPNMVRVIYGGKFQDVQAELFGFEGHLNAPTIERAIFGGNFNRFSWSTNGSPLSRSFVNDVGEKVGMDPFKDPEIRVRIEAAKHATPGEKRIYTLVDTYNMQLTLFESVRPPVTLMLCASEGGMQRAVGCSYEWETQTMFRETVLRMPTTTLNRLDRVPRFRFGLSRRLWASHPRS